MLISVTGKMVGNDKIGMARMNQAIDTLFNQHYTYTPTNAELPPTTASRLSERVRTCCKITRAFPCRIHPP